MEGLAQKLSYDVNEKVAVFGNFSQWFVEELNSKETNSDATMLTWQVGTTFKPTDKVKFQCAVAWYDFLDLEDMEGMGGMGISVEVFSSECCRRSVARKRWQKQVSIPPSKCRTAV